MTKCTLIIYPCLLISENYLKSGIKGHAIHTYSCSVAIVISPPTAFIGSTKLFAFLNESKNLFSRMFTLLANAGWGLKIGAFPCFQTNWSILVQPMIDLSKRMFEIDYVLMRFNHKESSLNLFNFTKYWRNFVLVCLANSTTINFLSINADTLWIHAIYRTRKLAVKSKIL